jgi:undecaprenyl-diphosphatase
MPARTPPIVPAAAAAAFLILLVLVLGDWSPVRRLDLAVSDWFRAHGTDNPRTVDVTRVVTDVMGTISFIAIGVAGTLSLAAARRPRAAGFCAAVTAAVPLLWGLMHAVLHRPRPMNGFVDIESNGFPSGHTSHAAATAVAVVLLLWPRLRRAGRTAVVVLGAVLAAAIGLTRVALLAHWPSDVLGGWLLALAVVPLLAWAFHPAAGPPTAGQSSAGRPSAGQSSAGRPSAGQSSAGVDDPPSISWFLPMREGGR